MKKVFLSTVSSVVFSALIMTGAPNAAMATSIASTPNDAAIVKTDTNTKVQSAKLIKGPKLSPDGTKFYDRNGNVYLRDGDIFYDHSGRKNNLTINKNGVIKDSKGRTYAIIRKQRPQPITPIKVDKAPAPVALQLSSNGQHLFINNKKFVRDDDDQPGALYHDTSSDLVLRVGADGIARDRKGVVYGKVPSITGYKTPAPEPVKVAAKNTLKPIVSNFPTPNTIEPPEAPPVGTNPKGFEPGPSAPLVPAPTDKFPVVKSPKEPFYSQPVEPLPGKDYRPLPAEIEAVSSNFKFGDNGAVIETIKGKDSIVGHIDLKTGALYQANSANVPVAKAAAIESWLKTQRSLAIIKEQQILAEKNPVSLPPTAEETANQLAIPPKAPENFGNANWDAKTRQLDWESLTDAQKQAWVAKYQNVATTQLPDIKVPTKGYILKSSEGGLTIDDNGIIRNALNEEIGLICSGCDRGTYMDNRKNVVSDKVAMEWRRLFKDAQYVSVASTSTKPVSTTTDANSNPREITYDQRTGKFGYGGKIIADTGLSSLMNATLGDSKKSGDGLYRFVYVPKTGEFLNNGIAVTNYETLMGLHEAIKHLVGNGTSTPAIAALQLSSDGQTLYTSDKKFIRDDDGQPGALYHDASGSGLTLRVGADGIARDANGSVYGKVSNFTEDKSTMPTPAPVTEVLKLSSDAQTLYMNNKKFIRDDDGQPGALYHDASGSGLTLRVGDDGIARDAKGVVYGKVSGFDNAYQLPYIRPGTAIQ